MDKDIRINGKAYSGVDTIKVRDAVSEELHAFRNTDDATIESKDIPIGKVGYGKDGIVIGTAIQTSEDGDINFYDQYGAWLISYSLSDLPLSALPEIPALEGAGADQYEFAWTMTLEEVNALTEEADIGVDVTAKEGAKTYLMPIERGFGCDRDADYVYIYTTATTNYLVDWGDGTTSNYTSLGEASTFVSHTFSEVSHNPITIEKVSGEDAYLSGTPTATKEIRFGQHLGAHNGFASRFCENILFHNAVEFRENVSLTCFGGCYNLKSLNIPKTARTLSLATYYVLSDCHYLESIFFHEGLESVGILASRCYSLKKIVLPKSFREITGSYLASECPALRKIKFSKTHIDITKQNYITNDCSSLETITMPESMSGELASAMLKANALKEFIVPEGITTLGTNCFQYCRSLESLTIAESVTSIGSYFLRYCLGLKQIFFKSKTPPQVLGILTSSSTQYPFKETLTVYVPKGSLEEYATATNLAAWAECMVEY